MKIFEHTHWAGEPPPRFLGLLRPRTLAFIALSLAVLAALAYGDRSGLLDQDNYVRYFREADPYWFRTLWSHSSSVWIFVVRMVTDELGWRLWVLGVDALGVSPQTGVRITVLAANLLVILALYNTRRPMLALVLWVLIPTGLATIGLYQIRQGFALGIAMYFAFAREKPVRGAILASIVHTTFAFPALMIILARIVENRSRVFQVAVVTAGAIGMSVASRFLFATFGGRRIGEYTQTEVLTLNFVIVLVIYLAVPLLVLFTQSREDREWLDETHPRERMVNEMAIMHFGLLAFLIVSFFVYPFATQRIVYYGPLMLAFMVPEIRLKNSFVIWIFVLVLSITVYDVIKNYQNDVYTYFL
jgi:hypothetical protein